MKDHPRVVELLDELADLADSLDQIEKDRVRRREIWCALRDLDASIDHDQWRRVTYARIAGVSRRTTPQVIRDVRAAQTDRTR